MSKSAVILGGGESGVGAAILAQKKGYEVFLSDLGEIKEKYKSVLSNYKIDFEECLYALKSEWFFLLKEEYHCESSLDKFFL